MAFKNFFLGPDGDTSSKRLFLFFVVCIGCMYFIVNLFWGKTMKPSLEDNLFYTIWGFFFGVAADRWRKPMPQQPSPDDKKDQ